MNNIIPFRKNIFVKLFVIFFLFLFFLFLFLNKEKEIVVSNITPPGDYSKKLTSLNVGNIAEISEVLELTTTLSSRPVSAAAYFPLKNALLSVSSEDGILRAWSLENEKTLYEYSLGITSNVGLGFDQSGDLILGPIWHQYLENDYGELIDGVGGFTVWDTKTGSLVACITYPCDYTASTNEWQRGLISGAVIDPNGDWVLSINETRLGIVNINNVEQSYSIGETRIDGSHRRMALGAFDPNNNNYAIAYRDGGVTIQRFGDSILNWFYPKINLGLDEINTSHQVVSLNYSPDGRWLARIQDETITIWDLNNQSKALYFEDKIVESKILAFDQSSYFLFIGTTKEVFVLDINTKEVSFKIKTPGITTLSVSSDNRLLIWGDESGIIHLWGIQ
jgi:WD40 repeat protein